MWTWGVLALIALLWPSRLAGMADGIPLDGTLEAVAIGVVFPALCWLFPSFLSRPLARTLIVALLVAKTASLLMVQSGWCVAFDSPRPMVRDSTGRLHSWDVRADWQSPDPTCSAVMTRSYTEPKEFPVWFFNLPPPDESTSANGYYPGQLPVRVTISGFLDVDRRGDLELLSDAAMGTVMTIDGKTSPSDAASHSAAALSPGRHFVGIDTVLAAKQWRLVPRWNDTPLGTIGFPQATMRPSSRVDRAVRPVLSLVISALPILLLTIWIGAWMGSVHDRIVLAWVAAGLLGVALAVSAFGPAARWFAAAAIAGALAVPIPARLRNARGAFLLVGAPWLAFVVAVNLHQIGRWTSYFVGVDNWSFQRYAYRIFLQGYWLEGGEATFWKQPLYRWIVGALHLAFGDSSVGQAYWDAACTIVAALFAFTATRAFAGFRWGLAASALTLWMMLLGPNLEWVGFGMSEQSSAGFLYLAALCAMHARAGATGALAASGLLAVLAFYTRLNNLPMALAVAVFALPLDVRANEAFRLNTCRSISWRLVATVAGAVGVGLLLFAWRTWYYTGVFSVFYGTQRDALSNWQPGASLSAVLARMAGGVMIVVTSSDPPRFALHALPLLVAAIASVAALACVPLVRDLPLPLVLFFLSGCAGALVARGLYHEGRFSVHLLGIAGAVAACTAARLADGLFRSAFFSPPAVRSHDSGSPLGGAARRHQGVGR